MGMNPLAFHMMAMRVQQNRKSKLQVQPGTDTAFDVPLKESAYDAVEYEIKGLHKPIIDWCTHQVPAVPYIHSRPDVESTIGEGVQDFTIFYKGQAICIECKSRTGKPSDKQRDWAHLMAAQGFVVHIVRDLQTFLELVRQ